MPRSTDACADDAVAGLRGPGQQHVETPHQNDVGEAQFVVVRCVGRGPKAEEFRA